MSKTTTRRVFSHFITGAVCCFIIAHVQVATSKPQNDLEIDIQVGENIIQNGLKFEAVFDQITSKNDESLNDKRVGARKSARFTELTTAIGKQSNENIRDYMRLQGLGIPRAWVLAILRTRRHPFCSTPVVACYPSNKYRTIDGRCNNYLRPLWGSSYQPFQRLFSAEYADGFNRPKGLIPQRALPNPREISSAVHPDLIHPDETLTNMIPQIGQFLDHDFALTIEDDRRCCTSEKNNMDCFNIDIPTNDVFYSNLSRPQSCMEFTRSTAFCFPTESGIREQFNIDTAYIDLSNVYGSESERIGQLREFKGGRLVGNAENPRLLPTVKEIEEKRKIKVEFMGKFLAGDNRVNEMPALAAIHTLWFHEHNRIANKIAAARPHWNDEKIFQETRRITIAEWQNVVYGQFLTTVLGNDTMQKYNLTLGQETEFSEYNSNLDATLFHFFATAAYRFGHTLLNGLVRLIKGFKDFGSYLVRDNYFDSTQLERGGAEGYDLILGGLLTQNAQTYDRFVSADFTNFLLKEKAADFGGDLVARNIQRSRDHAIPNYGVFRQYCGLPALTNWNNRPEQFLDETWQKLRSVYASPQDIELFPGGLSELPLRGAVSGPTFNCLKAKQFKALKFGDRFFFTHKNQAGSFNSRQLQLIRRRTLGDIICDNSQVHRTPVNVFIISSDINPWINCNDTRRTTLNIAEFV